jgi:hypothetical protein
LVISATWRGSPTAIPPKGLHALGDFIHQRQLLVGVLVEQEVQLVEGHPTHEPMVLLV